MGLKPDEQFKHNVSFIMNKDITIPILRETSNWFSMKACSYERSRGLIISIIFWWVAVESSLITSWTPVVFCLAGSMVTWVIDSSHGIRTACLTAPSAFFEPYGMPLPPSLCCHNSASRRLVGVFVVNNDEVPKPPLLLHLKQLGVTLLQLIACVSNVSRRIILFYLLIAFP